MEPVRPAIGSVSESKLHAPTARREWIERPRLVAELAEAARQPVVLIAAPAGYGKSTLATQWYLSGEAPERKAWVCLDSADNDPTRLWTHVATALERAGCLVEPNVAEFVAGNATGILTEVVPRVLEALAALPTPLALVLDDCHVVRSRECCRQIDHLIEQLPADVHLVLIARSDPGLRLGRLRVDGRLAEIRSKDLSFSTDEIATVLDTEGVRLSADALTELVRRTEGWPAAVYLAALSLRRRDDPDEFVHELSGNNRFLADYLGEEVLSGLDSDVREFVLDMSVFDRFNASLGDHVTQTQASTRLIRVLERTNLFLTPLDGAGSWFRFHHLFGSFARSALEAEDPARLAMVQARGMAWLAGRGYIDEAVQHALAAGDVAQAAILVQGHWVSYFDAGRSATVLEWLRVLHRSAADLSVETTVTAAWMAALTGHQAEMERRLELMVSMRTDGPLPDGTRSATSAAAMIRGLFGYDGPDRMIAEARRAVELETDPTTPWYAVSRAALGHANYVIGDLELARAHLSEAANAAAAPATVRLLALGLMSLGAAELGDLHSSDALAELAMGVVATHAMQNVPQGIFAFTALGAARAREGRLAEALTTLEDGLRARRQVPGLSPWPLIHHLIVTATVAARSDLPSMAVQLLAEVDELTPWTDETMDPMRARIARARAVVDHLRRAGSPAAGEPLTRREVEILRRLQGTQSLREIAADLYVSQNTIKTFTLSVYRKLGVHSRSEAVATARSHALI